MLDGSAVESLARAAQIMIELFGAALFAAAIGYCAYPLLSERKSESRRMRARAAQNRIEALVAMYNTQYALAPLRRAIVVLSLLASFTLRSDLWEIFAALSVVSLLSLSVFRRPVSLQRDSPNRFVPDQLLQRLAAPGALDENTRTVLAEAASAAGGVRTSVLRQEAMRLDRERDESARSEGDGYRALAGLCQQRQDRLSNDDSRAPPEQVDEAIVAGACLAVLDKAILLARILARDIGQQWSSGIDRARAAQLHDLLDAIHNIPAAVEAPASCFIIQSGFLQRILEEYDAKWARVSSQHSSGFARLSLLAIYEAALTAPGDAKQPIAAACESTTQPEHACGVNAGGAT